MSGTSSIGPIHFRGLSIPARQLGAGGLYRIELGISHKHELKGLCTAMRTCLKAQGFASANDLQSGKSLAHLFKPLTVADCLEANHVPTGGGFGEFARCCRANACGNIREGAEMSRLIEQEVRLVQIFILTQLHDRVFVWTQGMHLSALLVAYGTLRTFLGNGGAAVELCYPHFQTSDELKWMATPDLTTVQLGEMRI